MVRIDRRRAAVPALLVVTLLALAVGLWRDAGAGHPMSVVDEHMHLDTHARVHQGTYPHRGSLMSMPVVREWACGVGHEAGAAMAPCDHPDLGPNSLPSGIYTTGYIHYPTYFVVGEAYRTVATALGGGSPWIDTYRHYATVVFLLGVLACLAGAWRLGFRGARLLAATLAPVSASAILLYGTIANPQAAAVLCGALIGWSGLRWVLIGRGFWWLAAATALGAGIAVVQSLPAGAFMVAAVLALVLQRRGWELPGPWRPRWWQVGVLAVIVLTPVVVFGRWISERATIANSELYDFVSVSSWQSIVAGAVGELSSPHTPWLESGSLAPGGHASVVRQMVRAAVQGAPFWLNVLLFGMLVVVLVGTFRALRAQRTPAHADAAPAPRVLPVLPLIVLSALVTLALYPAALRVSNAVNVGIDHPVVARYSMAFTPLLVWLLLLTTRDRPLVGRALAVLAAATVLGITAGAW